MRRWLLIPGVTSLCAVAFYESWLALYEAAVAAEIYDPRPWPWMIDGFILTMAVMVVFARIDGHSWGTWWPRLGLLGATTLSTTIQAIYAPQDRWEWVLHAWSPLALLAAFEGLVWLVFAQGTAKVEQVERKEPTALLPLIQSRLGTWDRSQSGTAPVPQDVPVPVPERNTSQSQAGTGSKGGFSSVQKRMIRRWVAEGRSARWMTEELGLSDSDRIRKLGPVVQEIKTAQNGGRSHDAG